MAIISPAPCVFINFMILGIIVLHQKALGTHLQGTAAVETARGVSPDFFFMADGSGAGGTSSEDGSKGDDEDFIASGSGDTPVQHSGEDDEDFAGSGSGSGERPLNDWPGDPDKQETLTYLKERILNDLNGDSSECTSEYRNIQDHTMCKTDSSKVISSGVSRADEKEIVDLHNHLREYVTPPAADLPKLFWNDKIAAVAQKWAKQCTLNHDTNRNVPSYGLEIGQNTAGGYNSWRSAILAWYNEVSQFRYGVEPDTYLGRDGWTKVGHYTQIVQNTTYRIGCGFARCSGTEYEDYYVCNYGSGQSRIAYPYTQGRRCEDCPSTCRDGQCDCGGKLCLHGGTLDLNSCTCRCPSLYQGSTCDQYCPP